MLNESKKDAHHCCHGAADHCKEKDHQHHCCMKHHECSGTKVSFQSLFECLIHLRDQTLFAHWTVGGMIFASWHELYEKHYEQLNDLIDSYVEAALMHHIVLEIGGKDCCKKSIKSHNFEQSKRHMVALSEHLKHAVSMIQELIKSNPELCMQDLLTQLSVVLEKQAWFYKNCLSD